MRMIIKQIFSSFFYTLFIVLSVLTVTYFAFPLDHIKDILDVKVYGFNYLYIIGSMVLLFSLIRAIATTQLPRQHIRYFERQLSQLLEGQALIEEDFKDLKQVDKNLVKLQGKIKQHIEHAQNLATAQANAHEASLQEIVLEERNRLARDLHDAVSQQLFAASMMISAITEADYKMGNELKHQLSLVEKMVQQSQLEMRALLLHLRPVQLKGKHLQEGIHDLMQELMTRIPIELTHEIEDFPVEKGVENQLFRILQEAVSNTLRHAEASKMHILLIRREGFIILRMTDDGKGFAMDDVNTSSYGLDTMKERTEDLGGTFKVVSLPGEGTRIEVKIPIVDERGDTE